MQLRRVVPPHYFPTLELATQLKCKSPYFESYLLSSKSSSLTGMGAMGFAAARVAAAASRRSVSCIF